jgi:hypothetical protein
MSEKPSNEVHGDASRSTFSRGVEENALGYARVQLT